MYGVQCLNHPEAGDFWRDVAALTGGQHLKLDTLTSLVDIIMGICYREGGHDFIQVSEYGFSRVVSGTVQAQSEHMSPSM